MTLPVKAKQFIRSAFKDGGVVCLTGAGVSAESGIPTFRGKGGLWEKYDPQVYAYPEGLLGLLRARPRALVDFLTDLYTVLLEARPNPAHTALAALENKGIVQAVITQNIDNLHQRAGTRNCVEVHGNAFRIRCARCAVRITFERGRVNEMLESLRRGAGSANALRRIMSRYFPRCRCGGRFRIDVVLFGEPLPEDAFEEAVELVRGSKVLMLVGTSLAVYPAAGLPAYAKDAGAVLIEVNKEDTVFSKLCDHRIRACAGDALPQILHALERAKI